MYVYLFSEYLSILFICISVRLQDAYVDPKGQNTWGGKSIAVLLHTNVNHKQTSNLSNLS